MNNLDKYFDKVRKVEPDISQEDTRKILAGKLSDVGITTNLFNKIRTYPIITTLITSAAIVGVLMLSQFTESTNENIVDSKNKIEIMADNGEDGIIPVDDNEPKTHDHKKEKEFLKKNPPRPVDENITKKTKVKKIKLDTKDNIWTNDEVDIKAVNTLNLKIDELKNLGITVNKGNFKVSAFDKYTFTIDKDNNKERNPSTSDEIAFPTPAMVTTACGFKTLTLIKSDGIEAIVDREKNGDNQSLRMTSEFKSEVDFEVNDDIPLFKVGQMTLDEYSEKLIGHKDSAAIFNRVKEIQYLTVKMANEDVTIKLDDSLKNIRQSYIDRKVNLESEDLSDEDIEKIMITSLDSLDGDVIELVEVDSDVQSSNGKGRTIHMPIKSLGKGKKIKIKSIKESNLDDDVYVRDLLQRSGDDVDIKELKSVNVNSKILNSSVTDLSILSELKNLNKLEGLSKMFEGLSNMSFSLIKHDTNKLIPIEVSLDGDKTDFIVWYEATDEFLEKLPSRLIQKINPELNAADDQVEHCNNEPVKKDDAVMDVWSGCSGAIQGMKLYPNPAVDQSSVELSLKEDRSL
jgi:hypothetical protein